MAETIGPPAVRLDTAGYGLEMSDYSESGAVPVEDAAVEHPPTVDEVAERQRQEYPEQAATSMQRSPSTSEDEDVIDQED